MGRPRNLEVIVPLAQPQYQGDLKTVRNLWELASLMQFTTFFRGMLKLGVPESEVTIEVMEEDLLGVNSPSLLLDRLKKALLSGSLEPRFQTGDWDNDVCTLFTRRVRQFIKLDPVIKRDSESPETEIEKEDTEMANEVIKLEQEDQQEQQEQQEIPELIKDLTEFAIMFKYDCYNVSENKFSGFEFGSLSLSEKIILLHQLTKYMTFSDKFREKIESFARSSGLFSDDFRIAPVGWKGAMGSYYLLDDNRLYYRLDFEPYTDDVIKPKPPSKKRKKRASYGSRKRRSSTRIVTPSDEQSDNEPQDENTGKVSLSEALAREYDPEWSCVCWDLESWEQTVKKMEKSKDKYEAKLVKYLKKEILPVIREGEAVKHSAAVLREKAREKHALVANRKRSSRLEEKVFQKQEEEEKRSREEQIRAEEEKILHKEQEREKTRLEREKKFMDLRNKDHQQRLAALRFQWQREFAQQMQKQNGSGDLSETADPVKLESEESSRVGSVEPTRRSGRERKQRLIEYDYDEEPVHQARTRKQTQVDEDMGDLWYFDCYGGCGISGINYDDGNPSICCERCNAWMHVGCMPEAAELGNGATQEEEKEQDETIPEAGIESWSDGANEFICLRCRQEETTVRAKVAERYLRHRTKQQSPPAPIHASIPKESNEATVQNSLGPNGSDLHDETKGGSESSPNGSNNTGIWDTNPKSVHVIGSEAGRLENENGLGSPPIHPIRVAENFEGNKNANDQEKMPAIITEESGDQSTNGAAVESGHQAQTQGPVEVRPNLMSLSNLLQ